MRLLQDDVECQFCLQEAAFSASVAQMRKLFALSTFCKPSDPLTLWAMFSENMIEDFPTNHTDDAKNLALFDLQSLIRIRKGDLQDFGLPQPVQHGPNLCND